MERENLRQNRASIQAEHISSPKIAKKEASALSHYGKPLYSCLHVTEDGAWGPRAETQD